MTTPLTPIGAAPLGPPNGVPSAPVQASPPRDAVREPSVAKEAVPTQSTVVQAPAKGSTVAHPDRQVLEKAAADLKAYFSAASSELHYQEDKDTGQIVIKILNPTTREVIRQIPSEEIVTLAKKLRQLSKDQEARGVLIDEQG